MQNITPEDRKKWDKAIADHARRLKRQERSTAHRIFRAICVGTVAGIIITLVVAHYLPSPETQDPEIILNDTLQMNAGDISRDSSLDEMRKTPAGREYDALVKKRDSIKDTTTYHPFPGTLMFRMMLNADESPLQLAEYCDGTFSVDYLGERVAQYKKDGHWRILDTCGVEKAKELILRQKEDSL